MATKHPPEGPLKIRNQIIFNNGLIPWHSLYRKVAQWNWILNRRSMLRFIITDNFMYHHENISIMYNTVWICNLIGQWFWYEIKMLFHQYAYEICFKPTVLFPEIRMLWREVWILINISTKYKTRSRIHGLISAAPKVYTKYDLLRFYKVLRWMKICCTITILYHKFDIYQKMQIHLDWWSIPIFLAAEFTPAH